MVRIGRLLEIRQVTGRTERGKALKLAHRRTLVAVFALHGRVGTKQRKTILVIVDLPVRDLPPLNGVALRALRPHFPLMNIGMAVLANLSDVGEHRLGVALRAGHLFMHATKRILGFVVVEFRNRADGSPTRRRVAILAWYGKSTVRTSGSLPLRCAKAQPDWLQ